MPITVRSLLEHRTGCVYVVDYSVFANVSSVTLLSPHFGGIASVLTTKVQSVGNFDREYLFGHGFGARLAIEAGRRIGNSLIDRMDLCDPTGPTFDMNVDPKPAAKNVACINTSSDQGTTVYNCHQNFRMGYCGWVQLAGWYTAISSHSLCPHFYNLAFNFNFAPNNYYGCYSARAPRVTTSNMKMGYLAEFNRTEHRGDIFVMTAVRAPFVAEGSLVSNEYASLQMLLKTHTCL